MSWFLFLALFIAKLICIQNSWESLKAKYKMNTLAKIYSSLAQTAGDCGEKITNKKFIWCYGIDLVTQLLAGDFCCCFVHIQQVVPLSSNWLPVGDGAHFSSLSLLCTVNADIFKMEIKHQRTIFIKHHFSVISTHNSFVANTILIPFEFHLCMAGGTVKQKFWPHLRHLLCQRPSPCPALYLS